MQNIYRIFASLFFASIAAHAQTVLLQETFENGMPMTVANGGVWTAVNAGTGGDGTFQVVIDEENLFGMGTANQFLRVTNGIGFQLRGVLKQSNEVVTLSFLMAKRETTGTSGGSERLTCQFFAGTHIDNTNRAHILSLSGAGEIRVGAGTYPQDQVVRWDTILNNTTAEITYNTPGGGTATLQPAMATVWIDGVNVATDYINARQFAGTGRVHTVTFQAFSTERFSADLDNYTVFKGAHVLAPWAGAAPVHVTTPHLLFTEDFSSYAPDTPPTTVAAGGLWGTATWNGTNGSWGVVQDLANVFGQGDTNQFLRLTSTHNLNPGLITPSFDAQEVLVFSFDFIGRVNDGDGNRWLNVDARAGNLSAHVTSPRIFNATLRTDAGVQPVANPSYGVNDVPVRILTVVNNRPDVITYDRPDGMGTATLFTARASVWLYHYTGGMAGTWENVLPEYIFARSAAMLEGPVMNNVRFFMDSNAVFRSFDVDNVAVYGSIGPEMDTIQLSASVAGENIEIRWNGVAGRTYQVQYRTDVTAGAWLDLGSPVTPGADGEQLATDSLTADSQRFYQVVQIGL